MHGPKYGPKISWKGEQARESNMVNNRQIENPWKKFLHFATRKYVRKNTVLYTPGDIGLGFYYIDKGVVKITTYTSDGDEKLIDLHGGGEVFGEWALVNQPYNTQATTVEDSVLYFFSNQAFKKITTLTHEPLNYLLMLSFKKVWNKVEQNLLVSSAKEQIAFALLKLDGLFNSDNIIYISQQDLANYVGLSRITVNKLLQNLRKKGVIEVGSKKIVIKDKKYLSKLIDQ